jgi:hypothetical protein
MITTVHNAIPDSMFNNIRENLFSRDFPWYYTSTAHDTKSLDYKDYSWSHMVFTDEKNFNSSTESAISTAIISAMAMACKPISKILRIRLALITASESNYVNSPHVDATTEHKVGLIYLNTTNGKTVIYNEKYDYSSSLDMIRYREEVLKNNMTIMETSNCEANKMILFDGSHFHSSTIHTDVPRRLTINFNYL